MNSLNQVNVTVLLLTFLVLVKSSLSLRNNPLGGFLFLTNLTLSSFQFHLLIENNFKIPRNFLISTKSMKLE